MRFEDEIDIRRPVPAPGGSGVWQVLAILSMLAAGTLLVISLALGAVLYVEHRKPGAARAPAGKTSPAAFPHGGVAADDADAEPPNPPYPVAADLRPAGPVAAPGEERRAPRQTARARFLARGKQVWTAPEETFPQHVSVAPDGQTIAYLQGQALMVGPLAGEIVEVGGNAPSPPGRRRGPASAPPTGQEGGVRAVGAPAWSDDGRTVYFAVTDGRLECYDLVGRATSVLPFHGDSPVPVPHQPNKLIFRRSRAVPKADLPDIPVPADPAEIVLGDLNSGEIRVLVPEKTEPLVPLAVSPDGKQLALALGPAPGGVQPGRQRVCVLDMATGGKPKPVGPPDLALGPVCWAADGRALLYARQEHPLPPDCWEEDAVRSWAGSDLFRLDLGTGKETRLSRGGGFNLFSPTPGGELFFLMWPDAAQAGGPHLWRVPLAAAQEFAGQEPDRPARELAAWTKLMDQALEAAGIAPGAGGDRLTPDVLIRLADGFAGGYRERFQAEPPADADAWDRLHRELQALNVPGSARSKFALVLGAVEGEYLRRRHGAVWRLTAGPLLQTNEAPDKPAEEESPFGLGTNPFQSARSQFFAADDDDEGSGSALWLANALVEAQGRPLVLANSTAAAREGLQALADPRLARAADLFQQNKGEEAEDVLLQMARDKNHQPNAYLVLTTGKLLFEHKRLTGLRKLLEGRVDAPPPEPRKYNLLGLALLEDDPKAAARQFQNALRCDLYYGPGYLNLAQAYEKAGDPQAAALCLRRLLRLMPGGPLAGDARQRLAALQPAPAGPVGIPGAGNP